MVIVPQMAHQIHNEFEDKTECHDTIGSGNSNDIGLWQCFFAVKTHTNNSIEHKQTNDQNGHTAQECLGDPTHTLCKYTKECREGSHSMKYQLNAHGGNGYGIKFVANCINDTGSCCKCTGNKEKHNNNNANTR